MSEARIHSLLRTVAAAQADGADEWESGRAKARRVTGGFNNALYQVSVDGQHYAVKLCVADGRQQAAREYGVPRLLHSAGLDIGGRPLWLDDSCTIVPFPAVIYILALSSSWNGLSAWPAVESGGCYND